MLKKFQGWGGVACPWTTLTGQLIFREKHYGTVKPLELLLGYLILPLCCGWFKMNGLLVTLTVWRQFKGGKETGEHFEHFAFTGTGETEN